MIRAFILFGEHYIECSDSVAFVVRCGPFQIFYLQSDAYYVQIFALFALLLVAFVLHMKKI